MKNLVFVLFSLFYSTVMLAGDFLPPCNYPTLSSVTNITSSSAKITWTPSNTGSTNTVEYRKNGTTTWVTASPTIMIYSSSTTQYTTISNLLPLTQYQVRIKTVCSGATLYSSNKPYFTTLACSNPIPTSLNPANGTPSPTTLSWSGTATQLSYSSDGGVTWVSVLMPVSPYTLPALASGTYQWKLKNGCSNWTVPMSFTIPTVLLCSPTDLAQSPVVSLAYTYDLSWTNCPNPSGTAYRVDCYDGQYGTWTTPIPLSSTPTSVRIKSKSICYWRVTAINGGSYSLPAYSYDYDLPVLGSYMCPLLERVAAPTQPIKSKENNSSTTALTLYPNPTTGLISLQGLENIKYIMVVDVMGKQLLQEITNGNTQLEIDLTNYPAGMYFLKTDDGQVQKIVKQ